MEECSRTGQISYPALFCSLFSVQITGLWLSTLFHMIIFSVSILGVPCSDPAFRQEGGGDQIGVIWEPGPHSRSEWEEKPWLMFQQWPLTKMVIYTHIRGVSRMAKVKRDRKCQDDIIILTFANFKLIGFQTFVELTAYKNVDRWWWGLGLV